MRRERRFILMKLIGSLNYRARQIQDLYDGPIGWRLRVSVAVQTPKPSAGRINPLLDRGQSFVLVKTCTDWIKLILRKNNLL